jgi:hypothetical protein
MKFKTKIVQIGNNTGINVPEKIIENLGAGKKPPVRITLNKYTYQSTVAVMGGKYMVSLSAENRKNSKVAGGDDVEITIELDSEPRTVELPPEFEKALSKNASAKKKYEALSISKKKWLVLPIKDAKTEETKLRRIEKAISLLKDGKV